MFLVVDCAGRFWDGLGWNVKGRVFCTVGSAQRSLHEQGEEFEKVAVLPLSTLKETQDDSPTQLSPWDTEAY